MLITAKVECLLLIFDIRSFKVIFLYYEAYFLLSIGRLPANLTADLLKKAPSLEGAFFDKSAVRLDGNRAIGNLISAS